MSATITADLSRFRASLRAVEAATKRDAAEIVNSSLLQVAYKASQLTPARTPAEIESEMAENRRAYRIANARLQGKVGTVVTIRKGKRAGKTRKVGRVTRRQIAAAAKHIISKRKQGTRFLKAGWIPAMRALGGGTRGAKLRPGGSASKGYASKATATKLHGVIANASYGALKGKAKGRAAAMMDHALAQAVNVVAQKNHEYVARKIGETLRKHSDL